MELDANLVIRHLVERIAQLEYETATLRAQVDVLQTPPEPEAGYEGTDE